MNLFESLKIELGLSSVSFSSLGVETRLSSTFNMIESAYKAKIVLTAVANRVIGIRIASISDDEWGKAKRLCEFLKTATSVTEHQSGSFYITLSFSVLAYRV